MVEVDRRERTTPTSTARPGRLLVRHEELSVLSVDASPVAPAVAVLQ